MPSTETLTKLPMPIRSIAPYFGGKRSMAKRIAAELGEHKKYDEPFAGSMAVLMAKEPTGYETVCDMHGGMICLARVLACELNAVRLYERLQQTLFCESLLQDANAFLMSCNREPAWWTRKDTAGEEPSLIRADANMAEYAYWFFVACWVSRNGTAGTDRECFEIAVRWKRGGGDATTRFKSAVDSIPAWHYRLRNVVILRRNSLDYLPKLEDAEGAAIYADPPYLIETRGATSGHGRYLHDFRPMDHHFTPDLFSAGLCAKCGAPKDDHVDQHERLAKILTRFKKARVVVSYYDHPRVRKLYEGWTFVDCTRQKNLRRATGSKHTAKEAPEVLIINGPSLTAG